jgi:two-component system OmpR family response regulator
VGKIPQNRPESGWGNGKKRKMKTNKKRILVVDDEAHITFTMRMVFERMSNYEVKVENVAEQALAVAEKFRPDLILLDVEMPVMNGAELAGRAIGACHQSPLLA